MNTLKTLTAAAMLVASSVSYASFINVDGVVWNPDSTGSFPGLPDFSANGNLVESSLSGTAAGQVITGYGIFNSINSTQPSNTPGAFCPSCQLTFSFSMTLQSATASDFTFTNLKTTWYVDHVGSSGYTAYDGTAASATNGDIWLDLVGNGNLIGTGDKIGTGSDTGSGSALLDVVGGVAMGNFDTNTRLNGADLVFSSSFQPITGSNPALLFGTIDFTGNTIPEPTSLALIGIGLLGFGMKGKRKQA